MGWTTRGKVNVTLNSAVVTGVGSLFLQDGRIGDGFRGPDGRIYEVTNIATNTGLTIQPPYEGPTVNDATYYLAPFEGYVKDTADALRAASLEIGMLPASKQDKSTNLTLLSGLTSAVDKLPFFAGVGVMSLTALTAKARAFLGLTDEAAMRAWLQLVKITSSTDTVADRVMTTGFQGLGGPCVSMANWTEDFKKGSGFFQANSASPEGPGPAGFNATGVNLMLNAGPIGGQIAVFNGDNRMVFRSAYNAFLPWCEVVHSLNATLDPATNAGGLMSSSVINGFYISKYANGDMTIQGQLANIESVPANGYVAKTVTIPSGLAGSVFPFPDVTLAPFASNDNYGVTTCYMDSLTTVTFSVRNGSVAQSFGAYLLVRGRWK